MARALTGLRLAPVGFVVAVALLLAAGLAGAWAVAQTTTTLGVVLWMLPSVIVGALFIVYGTALLQRSTVGSAADSERAVLWRKTRVLVLIFVIFSATIAAAAFVYVKDLTTSVRQHRLDEQTAIAGVKAQLIDKWLVERWLHEQGFANTLKSLLLDGSGPSRIDLSVIEVLFAEMLANSSERVSVRLVGMDGKEIAETGEDWSAADEAAFLARNRSADPGKPRIDQRRTASGALRLDFIQPVTARPGRPPSALLVVTVDPEVSLLPEVERWPVPSRTSEIGVFRREGDKVIYIVPPRDTPPEKRGGVTVPMTDTSYHSVKAILEGDGVREGLDSRRIPVLTASRSLKGIDWHLVAKTDMSEALTPIQHRARLVVLLSAGAILIAAGTTFGLWRADRASYTALTQRRESVQAEADRMTHVAQALRAASSALLRARDETELHKTVCDAFVRIGGYRLASVAMANHDPGKTVRFVAAAGDDQGYLSRVEVTWGDGLRGLGPTGAAIRTGQVQVKRDYAGDPDMAPWRDDAEKLESRAAIGLPLQHGGETFGSLTIHSGHAGAFEPEEAALLAQFAVDVAYGIDKLRRQSNEVKRP